MCPTVDVFELDPYTPHAFTCADVGAASAAAVARKYTFPGSSSSTVTFNVTPPMFGYVLCVVAAFPVMVGCEF